MSFPEHPVNSEGKFPNLRLQKEKRGWKRRVWDTFAQNTSYKINKGLQGNLLFAFLRVKKKKFKKTKNHARALRLKGLGLGEVFGNKRRDQR